MYLRTLGDITDCPNFVKRRVFLGRSVSSLTVLILQSKVLPVTRTALSLGVSYPMA
jgi:hypothetical protein